MFVKKVMSPRFMSTGKLFLYAHFEKKTDILWHGSLIWNGPFMNI